MTGHYGGSWIEYSNADLVFAAREIASAIYVAVNIAMAVSNNGIKACNSFFHTRVDPSLDLDRLCKCVQRLACVGREFLYGRYETR